MVLKCDSDWWMNRNVVSGRIAKKKVEERARNVTSLASLVELADFLAHLVWTYVMRR